MVKTSFNSSIAGIALVLCLGVAGLDNATAQTTTLVLSGDIETDDAFKNVLDDWRTPSQ